MQQENYAMRKDICVQHWVSNCKVLEAFEHVREVTVRILNFV